MESRRNSSHPGIADYIRQFGAWRAMFDHRVFQAHGESGAHLPANVQDLQQDLTPEERDQVKALLAKHLKP